MVKLGKQKDSNTFYAVKILNKSIRNYAIVQRDLIKEAFLLKNTDHEHITKLFRISLEGVLKCNALEIDKDIAYAALEYMKNGELFDLIFETGAF